jgi:serine protease AprX
MAAICLFGLNATVEAAADTKVKKTATAPQAPKPVPTWNRKPTDHAKLDRKLNDRADKGGSATSRVIVSYKPGTNLGLEYVKLGARRGKKLNLIGAEVVELSNSQLRKLADNKNVLAMFHDRKTGGKMNRTGVVSGARAVQAQYGYTGAGVGVAVIDSGITPWHDDLTYVGSNPNVVVVNGQRVRKFVDFVNGQLTPYDDNGHGTHVAGIIAGNGTDTAGARAGIAPDANLISLKVLDDHGGGYISNVIAAFEWVVANRAAFNIRVVNVSVGAAVTDSFMIDPLTLAAKAVVDAGVTVVTAAGNLGKNAAGNIQYGGITAPGNAPWVLTVGAYSHEGTLPRHDDKMGLYSSRGPTYLDFAAKPDVVATGTGIVSLSNPASLMYQTKAAYLLPGTVTAPTLPYLSLTGTSMASPVVAGTVALMLQANPNLTPNLVKAIIQYTAQDYQYNALTQGAGFLNTKGAVDLAKFFVNPQVGQPYPNGEGEEWSKTILWGNHKLTNGVITPSSNAYGLGVLWGVAATNDGENIVWGTTCVDDENTPEDDCENVVWGTTCVDNENTPEDDCENIVWGTGDDENIVWGTDCGGDDCENVVWGTTCEDDPLTPEVNECEGENIVWGTTCEDDPLTPEVNECEGENIVWGTTCEDDPLTPEVNECEGENIVWGTSLVDDTLWGTASEDDNQTWGNAFEAPSLFADPVLTTVVSDAVVFFKSLFAPPAPPAAPPTTLLAAPPVAALPPSGSTGLGGGF